MLSKFFKKLMGIDKLEQKLIDTQAAIDAANKIAEQKLQELAEADAKVEVARQAEELSKLTPKERASKKGEPWVAVLDTHVNKDNIRNGFFELDWNDEFVLKLKQEGYGYDGDPDEEIVDRWFRELCANVVVDEGLPEVTTGTLDIKEIKKKNK